MKWCSSPSFLQHSGLHSCITASEAAGGCQGSVPWLRAGQAVPAAPIPVNKNVLSSLWSPKFWAFQRCAQHMEASTVPFLFYLERLNDDKCARWTIFAWRSLRSSSLCWCHKQLKAEPSKKLYTYLQIYSFLLSIYIVCHNSNFFPFCPEQITLASSFLLPPSQIFKLFSAQGSALQ